MTIARLFLTTMLVMPVAMATGYAQELTAGGSNLSNEMSWTALKNLAEGARGTAQSALTLAEAIKACGMKSAFYAPGVSGADAQGCKGVTVVASSGGGGGGGGGSTVDPRRGEIEAMYLAYTGRKPSGGEIDSWLATGQNMSTIRNGISTSQEAAVQTQYQQNLGRTATLEEKGNWVAQTGGNMNTVASGVQNSTEAQIRDAYLASTGRAPSLAEIGAWVNTNQSLDSIKAGITNSQEAANYKAGRR